MSYNNSKVEIAEKVELYLAKGAQEVWVVYEDGRMDIFTHTGQVECSDFSNGIRERIFS